MDQADGRLFSVKAEHVERQGIVVKVPRVCGLGQEEFQNEIDHFLERRKPLTPRELCGPTGFGTFLQEQKKECEPRGVRIWAGYRAGSSDSFRL